MRSALPAGLVSAALVLGACGGDDEPAATREPATVPEATATPQASPEVTPTPTVTSDPEEQPGGAGDEGGIEQRARFVVGAGGAITPASIDVTAFLPVRLSFENRTAAAVEVDLDGLAAGLTVAPGATEAVRLSGPRPGRYELRADDAKAVLDSVAGGAG